MRVLVCGSRWWTDQQLIERKRLRYFLRRAKSTLARMYWLGRLDGLKRLPKLRRVR